MSRSHRFSVAFCLLLLPPLLVPRAAEAQDMMAARVSARTSWRAGDLLRKSPSGPERKGTLPTDRFLAEAAKLTEDIWGLPPSDVDEAIEQLEFLAEAVGPVTARVQSVPTGLTVQYRRTYQKPSTSDPTITTDGDESLDVATYYVFETRDPNTGKVVAQTKNCLRGCIVRFVFGNAGP